MARARTLSRDLYIRMRDLLARVSTRLTVDRVILSLSFKAGLRAGEIAGLRWADVCDPFGKLIEPGDNFNVPNAIAKKKSGRVLPMHPELHEDLKALLNDAPGRCKIEWPIVPPARSWEPGVAMTPNTMQRYIGRLYDRMGMSGMSSHSGRRSFGTALARAASTEECSLKDVQGLLGHSNIATTELYVDPSDRVARLVTKL